jgi:hypothetical protein
MGLGQLEACDAQAVAHHADTGDCHGGGRDHGIVRLQML